METTHITTSELKEKLRQHLEAARLRLAEVEDTIAKLGEDDRELLARLQHDSHERIAKQKERERELRDNADGYHQEVSGFSEHQLAAWRTAHDATQLDHLADRAEEYAINAVVIAMMEADEVELAVIDAIAARVDADVAHRSVS